MRTKKEPTGQHLGTYLGSYRFHLAETHAPALRLRLSLLLRRRSVRPVAVDVIAAMRMHGHVAARRLNQIEIDLKRGEPCTKKDTASLQQRLRGASEWRMWAG